MILFSVIVATVLIEVITIPYIEIQILDKYIPQSNQKGLIIFVGIYIAVFILQCYMVLMHCDMRCILKRLIQKDLRGKVFSKLQYVKAKFYDENSTGTILQFLQDDTAKAGELFPIVITEMFIMGLVRFTVYLVFLLFINVKLTLAVLSLYIIGFIMTFDNIKLEKIISIYQRSFELIISVSTIIIIYLGGIEVLQGIMTYATITLMLGYSSQLEYEFNWFIKHLTDFNQSVISYTKILQLLEKEDEELLNEGNLLQEKVKEIEFKNVSFAYDEHKNVIKNFSFKARENERIALIGRTGSGKTTITNLLSRLYELQKGKILINGRENKEYTIKSIRNKIGYIMQEVQIVPTTIIDNIKYVNNDIALEEIEEIFKQLKLHEKIMTFKDGYYTDIYNNPNLLSTRGTSIN